MGVIGTYDRKIFYNPATKYCVVSMKSEDPSIPEKARAAASKLLLFLPGEVWYTES